MRIERGATYRLRHDINVGGVDLKEGAEVKCIKLSRSHMVLEGEHVKFCLKSRSYLNDLAIKEYKDDGR